VSYFSMRRLQHFHNRSEKHLLKSMDSNVSPKVQNPGKQCKKYFRIPKNFFEVSHLFLFKAFRTPMNNSAAVNMFLRWLGASDNRQVPWKISSHLLSYNVQLINQFRCYYWKPGVGHSLLLATNPGSHGSSVNMVASLWLRFRRDFDAVIYMLQ
jgi:hypothetical protein